MHFLATAEIAFPSVRRESVIVLTSVSPVVEQAIGRTASKLWEKRFLRVLAIA
jgi:hypothetical protein